MESERVEAAKQGIRRKVAEAAGVPVEAAFWSDVHPSADCLVLTVAHPAGTASAVFGVDWLRSYPEGEGRVFADGIAQALVNRIKAPGPDSHPV